MGFFDDVFDLPGKVVSKTVEAVVRLPEVPIKMVSGVIKGVERGVDKVMDSLDE